MVQILMKIGLVTMLMVILIASMFIDISNAGSGNIFIFHVMCGSKFLKSIFYLKLFRSVNRIVGS